MNAKTKLALYIFFIGVLLMSVNLSITFADKMKQ